MSDSPDQSNRGDESPVARDGPDGVMYSMFLSNLDSSLSESELEELMRSKSFGDSVYSVAIVTDRDTNQSKGFGFVHFTDKQAYENALQECSQIELKGKTAKAFPAEDKTKVYVRNLPKDWSEDKIKDELTNIVGSVKEINLRGEYAFLTFVNFVHAERGIKKLNDSNLAGNTLHAEPAKSTARNRESTRGGGGGGEENSTCLHVRHITPTLTKEALQAHFDSVGGVREVRIPQDKTTNKNSGFAFVEFEDNRSAQKALDKFNRTMLDGSEIEISFSRNKSNQSSNSRGGRDNDNRGGRNDRFDSRGGMAGMGMGMGYPPYGYPGMPGMPGRGGFPPAPYGGYMPYNPYAAAGAGGAGGRGGRESATAFPAYGMPPAMGGYPYMDPRYMAAYGMMGGQAGAGAGAGGATSSSSSSSKKESSSSRRRSRSRSPKRRDHSESRSRSRSRSRDRKRR